MIVLTGGAGFIGSCFLKKLNKKGVDDILVVDRLGKGDKWKNLVAKNYCGYADKYEFVENPDKYGDVEAIIHMGACSDTTERDADYLMRNNFNYSVKLAEYAEKKGARFIYASSAATYGVGEEGYSDLSFNDLKPLNMYGYTKQLFDLWVLRKGLQNKFTGFKFFNVFGPNEYHKGAMASMVYKALGQILDEGKVKLFRSNSPEYYDGGQKRDFIYVKDVTEVLWKAYEDKDVSGIYNLGTGIARNWNDLMKSVFEAAGKDVKIEYVDMPDSLKKQYQNFTQADMNKSAGAGLSIEFSTLEDSVEDYVKNYLLKDWKYL